MCKVFYTALAAAFIVTACFDHPATAAPAGTGPTSASQLTTGATRARQTRVRGARVRRAAARLRRPAVGARAVQSNEQSRTGELNRQSLHDLVTAAGRPHSQRPAFKANAASAQDDPPLNHPLPEALDRFANENKTTKEGWTSTLGLLPPPETKLSLPSPDVRLQERAIHLGAIYRF
jgi:hypothetical protein